MQNNHNIFVVSVDMENRPVEDIAREAALKIAEMTDALVKKYNQEKANRLKQEGDKSEKNTDSI